MHELGEMFDKYTGLLGPMEYSGQGKVTLLIVSLTVIGILVL